MTKPHAREPPGLERAQERGPERAVLAVADVDAEDVAVPVRPDPDRNHDGLGDDLMVDARLAVGGVEEDVRVGRGGQGAAAERGDLVVQVGAQIRLTSLLEIPVATPRACTRSSTFLVETPCR
jgi:hypothetical protein